jgi:hypothetical protein
MSPRTFERAHTAKLGRTPAKSEGLDERQPVVRDCLARGDRQRAAFEPGQIVQHLRGGLGAGYNTTRLVQELATGLRQHDAAADAVERFDAVARFKCGQLRRSSRIESGAALVRPA